MVREEAEEEVVMVFLVLLAEEAAVVVVGQHLQQEQAEVEVEVGEVHLLKMHQEVGVGVEVEVEGHLQVIQMKMSSWGMKESPVQGKEPVAEVLGAEESSVLSVVQLCHQ
jgi:hypothetical protein